MRITERRRIGQGASDESHWRSVARRRIAGVTLVEILVALVLLSFVFAGLLALTRSTLRFTGLSVAVADSITDVAKAEGYVADLFRVAKAVYGSIDVGIASGGSVACRLEGAVPGRCIGLLIPVVNDDGGVQQIVDYDLSVLSVEPIADRFETAGVPRGFDGEDTLTLFEYRSNGLCAALTIDPCVPATVSTVISASPAVADVGILLGGISALNAGGDAVRTFALAGDDAASRTLLLRFIVRAHGPTGSPFTVRESSVALEVGVRGLPQN